MVSPCQNVNALTCRYVNALRGQGRRERYRSSMANHQFAPALAKTHSLLKNNDLSRKRNPEFSKSGGKIESFIADEPVGTSKFRVVVIGHRYWQRYVGGIRRLIDAGATVVRILDESVFVPIVVNRFVVVPISDAGRSQLLLWYAGQFEETLGDGRGEAPKPEHSPDVWKWFHQENLDTAIVPIDEHAEKAALDALDGVHVDADFVYMILDNDLIQRVAQQR